ncbi:response regulator [Candidatus Sulfidibacterium hydrothermale]|uniref:hybrid sensor histidine kinase/response regulator n=1 Tax=Candidatus Sulfidibacterium hydrothermale TaxID=2875962 RepID=UPI001F0A6DFD|nr:response regulator [Candidatus Sulfidibacterium hydrothermale]UBM62654.1 response regulator [Candidatus Sulfidibacterium hydrothermale]
MMQSSGKHKILIVDDIPKNIQILGNILSKENYQIAYAQSGNQALSITKYEKFDLILLDIMMPGMDGFEVCRALKNDPETSEIPIIFLTAKADMNSIVKGFASGGQDYITKPFNASELLARTRTHIQLHEQKIALQELNEKLEEKVRERTRQLEEAYERLNQTEKAKTDFLDIISHELRTPLNGIAGLTTLLNLTELNEEQREYLRYLEEVAGRLTRFSETALLITDLKVNQNQPDFLPTQIKYILESVIHQFEQKYQGKYGTVRLVMDNEKMMLSANTSLLKKSLDMLLENAVKYGGPEVNIQLTVTRTKKNTIISCEDDGPGFNEKARQRLFEIFTTGDILHDEGTGLSLAAVKLIMDYHNGKTEAGNRPEGGAYVRLIF